MPTDVDLSPIVMVDIVVFSVADNTLQVLLIQRQVAPSQEQWALPGGLVQVENDHNLEAAALRELTEQTGIKQPYLEQLATYGSAERDPSGWAVSVAYFALVVAEEVNLNASVGTAMAKWHDIANEHVSLTLAFDHATILQDALSRLRAKLDYTDIPVHLLPREFTLSELQHVYEIIMQEKLNKASFRLRVERAGIVRPVQGKMRTGSNRPAQLYEFIPHHTNRVFFPRSIVWAQEHKR